MVNQLRSRLPRALLLVALAGCTGQIGDGDVVDPNGPTVQGFQPPAPTMRRLLGRQYLGSIGVLLGPEAQMAATAPDDHALNGFDAIGAAQQNVGDVAVVDYERSARAAAAAAIVTGDLASNPAIAVHLTCEPTGPDDGECLTIFTQSFGRLAFRRALDDEEVADLVAVGLAAGDAYGTFDSALEHTIATVIESPSFLYQVEVGLPLDGDTKIRRLTPQELATRVSFFLVDHTPSLELLDQADAGALDTPEGLRHAAEALLADPSAQLAVSAMYDEILGLRNLPKVSKNNALFPEFDAELAESMRQESLHLITDLVWTQDADFGELFTSDRTFVDANLAALYGVTAPPEGEWQAIDFPAEQARAGFLTQPGFLAAQAHVELTSPTLRGKFIRERLLCQSINPPPNDVSTEFPDDEGLKTMREKLAVHQENPSCAGCHALTDPMGLGFENFDAIGRYRETDNGVVIDASGELDEQGHFDDAAELAGLITEHPAFDACLVRNIYRASLGHIETAGEEVLIDELVADFGADGRRLRGFLVELVVSDAFRFVGAEP